MADNKPLVSIVIPVHNGAKYIKRAVKGLLNQSYKNLEIILVENFSSDDSLNVCKALEQSDKRVRTFKCFKRGTSLARRLGVEMAKGKYITFSDQDDKYINNKCIENMCKAIIEDKAQVVQFGYYREYRLGIKRKILLAKKNTILERAEFLQDEIKGIFSTQDASIVSVHMWCKIFDADVLKDAVKNINEPMFFSEDMYLSTSFFLNPKTVRISSRPECYYVWNVCTGFSAQSSSGKVLIDDYEKLKPFGLRLAKEQGVNEKIFYQYYLETVYLQKVVIQQMIEEKVSKEEILELIEKLRNYKFINQAKQYFIDLSHTENIWDELKFLISDYEAEEYYNYCVNNIPKKSLRSIISSILRI